VVDSLINHTTLDVTETTKTQNSQIKVTCNQIGPNRRVEIGTAKNTYISTISAKLEIDTFWHLHAVAHT